MFLPSFVGKNLTIEQLWKKVCSLIKDGYLPYCNAKLQVCNNFLLYHKRSV